MAAEWNMYGSARMRLFYQSYDEDLMTAATTDADLDGFEDDTDLDLALQGNSRIGANVKASDVVSGRFEYGTGVNVRLLYGVWNFGAGKLLVGQDYTPIDTLYSNQVVDDDNGLLFEGMTYEGRIPQLKLMFGGFQAALVGPSTSGLLNEDKDVTLPKIEVAFDLPIGAIGSVGAYGGYQTYDANEDNSIDAFVVGARAKLNFGPVYVNPNVFFSSNPVDYGLTLISGNGSLAAQVALLKAQFAYDLVNEEEGTAVGGAVAVGAKFTDMVGIEAGVGYLALERDENEMTVMAYYVQVPLTLAPGVFIIPEISVSDFGDFDDGTTETDLGQKLSYGAKFQINF